MNSSDIKRNDYVASCFLLPNFKHSHDFFELSFGVHGQSVNIINDKDYVFGRGSCVIIRPGDNHYFKKVSPPPRNSDIQYEHKDIYVKHEHFIEICNTLHPNLYEKIMANPSPLIFNITDDFFNFIWQKSLLLEEAMQKKNSFFTILHTTIVTAILTQWVEREIFTEPAYPQWINNLLPSFNSADFLSLSITDIAKSVGYSLPYFSSEFKKNMGISVKKYLNKKRLLFSKQLLAENRMNILDVSMLLGFANPSTYSKHFLEEFGISPSEYRKRKNQHIQDRTEERNYISLKSPN